MNFTDLVSTVGVSFILLAFFLSTFNYFSSNSKLYFILNLIGGVFACYGSILLHSAPFIVLEATWAIVALIGWVKLLKQ